MEKKKRPNFPLRIKDDNLWKWITEQASKDYQSINQWIGKKLLDLKNKK